MSRHIIIDSSGHTTFEFDGANTTDLAEAVASARNQFLSTRVGGDRRKHIPMSGVVQAQAAE